jgi:DNA polymerase I-like protein with 3'-5' exonuclease and polymerase domains
MLQMPNIRDIFIPDRGYAIFDFDLVGAEAMLIAWEIGGNFKRDFLAGVKIHIETMKVIFPAAYRINEKHEPEYTKCKNLAYGTIYGGKPRGIGAAASIPEALVSKFQQYFFTRYPEIREYHRKTDLQLMTKREIFNPFGYRIHYFDRPEALLPEALAWKPQSTIAIVTQRACAIILREFPWAELLLQVHDSIIPQIQFKDLHRVKELKARISRIPVPYPDPLHIPWGVKASIKSWGAVQPFDVENPREVFYV